MKKCSNECEPLCDFCINFESEDWICVINGEEKAPHDSCEENFECFRCEVKNG